MAMTERDPPRLRVERLEKLVASIASQRRPPAELTVFNIGGRGYFENATSDVLAFFLDDKQAHGLGRLVLDALLGAAGVDPSRFTPVSRPRREHYTSGGNRIDIVIEGDGTVLAIENKIRHTAINPFDEYESDLSNSYPNKEQIRILLTIRDEGVSNWTTARYQSLTRQLRERIGALLVDSPYGKWMLLLREFILTLEEEMVNGQFEEDELKFAAANFQALGDAIDVYWKYIGHLIERASKAVTEETGIIDVRSANHDWGKLGRALRIYCPDRWASNSNVVLRVLKDGRFGVRSYAYGLPSEERQRISQMLRGDGCPEFWDEVNGTIFAAGDRSETGIEDLERALMLLKQCARRMTALYQAIPIRK